MMQASDLVAAVSPRTKEGFYCLSWREKWSLRGSVLF